VSQLIDRRSDEELLALMSNLGGHDMASMIEAFEAIDHTVRSASSPTPQGRRPADAGPTRTTMPA